MDEGGIVDKQLGVLAGRRMTACGIVLFLAFTFYILILSRSLEIVLTCAYIVLGPEDSFTRSG